MSSAAEYIAGEVCLLRLKLRFWWRYNKTNMDCFISGNGEIYCL